MRKTVLFLIAVVCLLSVFVVAFFGIEASIDQFKVYIDSVEITSFDNKDTYLDKGKRIELTFDDNGEIGASYFIGYKIGPNNATNKSNIAFSIDELDTEKDEHGKVFCYGKFDGERLLIATIDQKGELTFFKRGTINVSVRSLDGIPVEDKVRVRCK